MLNHDIRDKVSGEPILDNASVDDFPIDITLCSAEEEAALKPFEHAVRTDILSMPKSELRHMRDGVPDYCSPTFYYEFSRQISPLLTAISGCDNFAEKAEFYRAWSSVPVNFNGWTYSTMWLARLPSLPDDIENKEVNFIYRWKSLKGREYLTPFDEIGADNILFELCKSNPPVKLNCGSRPAVIPDKTALLDFLDNGYLEEIYKAAKLEAVRPKAYKYYFELNFCHLRDRHRNEIAIKFKSKKKPQKLFEFHKFFVDLVEEINAKHGSDIFVFPKSADYYYSDSASFGAMLDFRDSPMELLVEIVNVLNDKTKGIKSVKLFNYRELFESSIDNALLNDLLNR